MTDAALDFMREAIDLAIHEAHKATGVRNAPAKGVIDAVVRHAVESFGMCAGAVLLHLRIRTSRDVGLAVWRLIKTGKYTRDKNKDRLSHFEGVDDDLPGSALRLARAAIARIHV
jgi:uncharacterized repeat protein (TIGR04138 family)